ncbi:MAG: hypothetical protein CL944_02840 [Candidatus Diapherotrites archaeon]|uniref:DUF2207 domain-containing protein n=1 Tax=Candidatus Iainarchaeum sp. TaxID=3101447 RepID=A0A2D6LQI1_9ARCH|nr:hypothetical protein [Candidatus Diapherotrites archaeon]
MKKFLILIGLALLLTLAQMNIAFAAQSDGYVHKNHYYAVSFDGEGDAIVRAQIDIENTLNQPRKWVDLEIPGQVVIYKAVQESPVRSPVEYSKTLTSNATILHLELKESIPMNSQGTIVLFYKIPRYAKRDLVGNYNFDFKTIIDKDAILIENLRVAVNVQEGLFMKGGEAKVDYKPNIGFMGEMAMSKTMDVSIESPYYRDYYYSIRNAQGLVKTARNLDPFESFHVKGNYGENWLALYFFDLIAGIIGAAVLIVVSVLGFRQITKVFKTKNTTKGKGNDYVQSALVAFGSAIAIVITNVVLFFTAVIVSEFSYSLQWIVLLIGLLGILVSFGLLFLPSLYVSSKKGIIQGALVFFLTIFFLIAISIFLGIAYTVLFPPRIYY